MSLKTEDEIEGAIENFNKLIQESAWLSTPEINDKKISARD